MVKRYPHSAEIVDEKGSIQDGEWVEGIARSQFIQGRFETQQAVLIKDQNGNHVEIVGEFYTRVKKPDTLPVDLVLAGRTYKVIDWYDMQNTSIIWLG